MGQVTNLSEQDAHYFHLTTIIEELDEEIEEIMKAFEQFKHDNDLLRTDLDEANREINRLDFELDEVLKRLTQLECGHNG